MDDVRGQAPLAGSILCCSALKTEIRDEIHRSATEMGARCTYDLTMENTHLIIGDGNTPKYRYVAKERPDVKVLLSSFVEAVLNAWKTGGVVKISPLEEEHRAPPLYGLSVCLTGFNDATERASIIQMIMDHGARYDGDLSRHTTTHLIAKSPTGKKYQMAPSWDIAVVAEEWLHDSVERGMALDERCYSLSMQPSDRGRGAWNRNYRPTPVSPGKRTREAADASEAAGRRKIRRTMSHKLSNDQDAIWANIKTIPQDPKPHRSWDEGDGITADPMVDAGADTRVVQQINVKPIEAKRSAPKTFAQPGEQADDFAGVDVYMHDFHNQRQVEVVKEHLGSRGARCFSTKSPPNDETSTERSVFVMVPAKTRIKDLTPLPDSLSQIQKVTEWWLEACLFDKQIRDPTENRLFEPFFNGEIPDFKSLRVSSTGFENMDRLNVSRAVEFLGGSYEENIQHGITVVICNIYARSDRREGASRLGIPVVTLEWLINCARYSKLVPFERHFVMKKPSASSARRKSDESSAVELFSTTQTQSMSTAAIEKEISERVRQNSRDNQEAKSNNVIDQNATNLEQNTATPPESTTQQDVNLTDDIELACLTNNVNAPDSITIAADATQTLAQETIEHPPRRASHALQEIPSQRLNSPAISMTTSTRTPQKEQTPAENQSAKSEEATNALVAMLEAKKYAKSSNTIKDARHLHRKRSGLGRALSSSTDAARRSVQNSPTRMSEPPVPDKKTVDIMASQKLVYEEREIRVREMKLFADIGGNEMESDKSKVDQIVAATKSAKKKTPAKGKSRAKRKQ